MGRTKDIIVLPNGLNVYPEDIENALRTAGLRDSVVIETKPGRIEAVVLPPAASGDGATPEAIRASVQAGIKAANATLAQHQRVAGFRIWPEDDLPRTHTLKVKRDVVRRWAADRRAASGARRRRVTEPVIPRRETERLVLRELARRRPGAVRHDERRSDG